MTRDLDTPLEISLGVVEPLNIWMSYMTWTRLTVHWIVSDCDLGRSVFTHKVRVVKGYTLCGLYTGVRGQAVSIPPGS